MLKKNKFFILGLFLLFSVALMNVGYAVGLGVETLPVHWVGHDSAVLKGNVTDLGGYDPVTVLFTYTKTGEDSWTNSTQTENVSEIGDFTLNIFGLDEYTNYTYKAIAYSGVDIATSLNNETFLTSDAPDGTYTAEEYENEDDISVTFTSTISDMGNATTAELYVVCFYGEDFLVSENTTFTETGEYTTVISEFEKDVTYYCYPTMGWTYDGNDLTKQLTATTVFFEPDTEVESGILNTRSMLFVAFGLISLILLITLAMFLFSVFSDGSSFTEMLPLLLWAIGAAIVIMFGYIIISAVAQALL